MLRTLAIRVFMCVALPVLLLIGVVGLFFNIPIFKANRNRPS